MLGTTSYRNDHHKKNIVYVYSIPAKAFVCVMEQNRTWSVLVRWTREETAIGILRTKEDQQRERNNLRPSETGEESALRLPLKTIYVQQHSIVVVVVVVVVGDIYQEGRKPSGPILETRTKRANNNRNNNSATDRREKEERREKSTTKV
jgi:hypothetical protein